MQQLHGPSRPAPSGTAKQLIVTLHGLGSNGADLFSFAPQLAQLFPDAAVASPDAPFPCDMAPFGYQWFSLQSRAEKDMLAGIQIAAPILNHYLDEQLAKHSLTEDKLALIGFSQGTMMALYAALRRPKPIAGIVGFSGALVGGGTLPADVKSKPPVCLVHGMMDQVVPHFALGHAEAALRDAGVSVETHSRPNLAHSIDPEGLQIGVTFLQRVL